MIFASQSATRLALLRRAGLAVEARPARIEEAAIKASARAQGASPADVAALLAELKAARVAAQEPEALVIAADQILVCGERWFDKPDGPEAAREQLRALRGSTHRLITAVLCWRGDAVLWRHVSEPSLAMRAFSEDFLNDYLATEGAEVMASVGAYRLEGIGAQLFERVEGDYFAVLGLPLIPLLGFLRQYGVLVT